MRKCLFLLLLSLPALGQQVEKGIKFNGSLSIGASYYHGNAAQARRPPFNWYLSGAPVLTVFGISLPFSLVVSDQDRRFSQPFNQYGVSPRYKWVTLHAGYRNLRFSEFTLNGANMLGGGFEINPGLLRLGAMYGRLNRAVEADSITDYGSLGYIRPTYKRTGFSGKIGIGKPQRYLDLVVFSAKDDTGSIQRNPLVKPEQNVAIGLKSQLGFFKNRLQFDLDGGISLLTKNLLASSALDSADSPILNQARRFIRLNNSSGFYTALQSRLSYSHRIGALRAEYRKIDPGYRSLGAYYFQSDVEQVTLSPSFQLGRLALALSYGLGRDNLDNKRISTSKRQVYSANVNILASNSLNINLDYSNFGFNQTKGNTDVFNDTTAIQIINSNLGGVISYKIPGLASQQLTVSTYYQSTDDLNRFTENFSEATTLLSSLSYTFNLPKKKWNSSAGLTYNNTRTAFHDILLLSPSISASCLLLKDKIRASLTENFQLRQTDGEKDGHTSATSLVFTYRLKKHAILWSGHYLSNRYQSETTGRSQFSEFRSNISYSISL